MAEPFASDHLCISADYKISLNAEGFAQDVSERFSARMGNARRSSIRGSKDKNAVLSERLYFLNDRTLIAIGRAK